MLQVDYQTPERMAAKRAAIPLPELAGKRVLDVGCDMAAWCRIASDLGAADVVGLDRNRAVRGTMVDLIAQNRDRNIPRCRFERSEIGKQYRIFGHFDVVLCFSVYHHMFEAAGGDHEPIWFWLYQHARLSDSVLLWEGPVDTSDPVVRANVSAVHHGKYTRATILDAATRYFSAKFIGPALHEQTREVWRFRPRMRAAVEMAGTMQSGAGGASKAFEYANGRRMDEIERALGWRPVPGSLNVRLEKPFDWNTGYFRAQILDVENRAAGLDSKWGPRWGRFYPVSIDGEDACAFRFEGEKYREDFLELVAPWRLRDVIAGPQVTISC